MRTTYSNWVAVAARSSQFPEGPCEQLYVGGAGTLTVILQDGRTVTLVAIAGSYHPVKASYVSGVGAATNVYALYP